MGKKRLLPLALVPLAAGYFYTNTFMPIFARPILGTLWFWLLPAVLLVFWFWVGRKYAGSGWNLIPVLLLVHAVGILCLAVYLWQFLLVGDGARNMLLATFSQSYAPVNHYTSFLAIRFEPAPHVIGRVSFTAIQVLDLLLMMAVFSEGCWFQRKKAAP